MKKLRPDFKTIADFRKEINKAIEKYLADIDQTDQEEENLSSPSAQELQKKIGRLKSSRVHACSWELPTEYADLSP